MSCFSTTTTMLSKSLVGRTSIRYHHSFQPNNDTLSNYTHTHKSRRLYQIVEFTYHHDDTLVLTPLEDDVTHHDFDDYDDDK